MTGSNRTFICFIVDVFAELLVLPVMYKKRRNSSLTHYYSDIFTPCLEQPSVHIIYCLSVSLFVFNWVHFM